MLGFRDLWEDQPTHVEVWVEKEALAGIVAQAANRWALGFISCRGYMSASEMWEAGQRFVERHEEGKVNVVPHLGDHDPSGIDMSRDIRDRLTEFCEAHSAPGPTFRRLGLNMNQVKAYNPPPNPAKLTDSRFRDYVRKFGDKSWELDALEPRVLDGLIDGAIRDEVDADQWAADQERLAKNRARLQSLATTFSEA